MPTFDLVVLGDANPDLVLRGGQVEPAFGQAEHIVEDATLTVGGSGGILACGAAKLGLRVALCAVVGDDLFGRYMHDELARRGVDTRGIIADPRGSTGLTVVLSKPDDRGMLTMTGTIGDLRREALDPALLADTRHIHVSSYFLQQRLRPELPRLFDEVREAGVTTSVDPNWDPSGGWDGGLLELLTRTDVFLPNAMEATRIAHISDLDEAIARLVERAKLVVVKAGNHGAVAGGSGEHVRSPAVPAAVVDTTGAGDGFDAGFLASWLGGESLERSLAIANACGALSTRAVGGVNGQATMAEARATAPEGQPA